MYTSRKLYRIQSDLSANQERGIQVKKVQGRKPRVVGL